MIYHYLIRRHNWWQFFVVSTYQVNSEQILYCAYSPTGDQSGTPFDDKLEKFDNGTVKCVLEDGANALACMSIFELRNVTDIYGNVTGTAIHIRGQGK